AMEFNILSDLRSLTVCRTSRHDRMFISTPSPILETILQMEDILTSPKYRPHFGNRKWLNIS
ncbi:MAG TPA: hypothetical protein VF884_02400, partial [Nitrososphaeraceae archaeon]